MLKWLRYLTLIPQLVALVKGVLELVRTAEDFIAGGQRGAQKRELVLALLDTAIELGAKLGLPEVRGLDRVQVREAAGAVVDAVVAVLNRLGVFRHQAAPPERG